MWTVIFPTWNSRRGDYALESQEFDSLGEVREYLHNADLPAYAVVRSDAIEEQREVW